MEQYKCLKCGNVFTEEQFGFVSYSEYSGGKIWKEEASPCCLWHYTDI